MATPSNSVDEASSSSSEITVIPHIAIAYINPAGFTISLKFSRDNFILWKTQFMLVLAAYDLVTLLDQDPPMVSHLDKDGRICPNPAYKLGLKMIRLFLQSSHLLYLNLFFQYLWEKHNKRSMGSHKQKFS